MNILVIHNSYRQPGGEDVVVAQETRLLERHGHKVRLYARSNNEIDALSFAQRVGSIARMISADDSRQAVRTLIRDFHPDIAHVHNTFMRVSPSIYQACYKEGVPVVQTLHNYRLLCPASTFYRDGEVCEECVTHGLLRSVRHACYRDSHVLSGAVALMLSNHRSRQTWSRHIDTYIAISPFARNKFVGSGLPAEKFQVKANFVDPDPGERSRPGDYALFVGRLSPEKGLATLLQAWERLPSAVPLVIAGDGPMRRELEGTVASRGLQNVSFVGQLSRDAVYVAMQNAAFLIVPSTWYEPFGLIIAEAFACGTPVLGASIGAIPAMVEDNVTGLVFAPGNPDSLAQKVAWASRHVLEMAAMGKAARQVYLDRYTANANYKRLMEIYGHTISTRRAGSDQSRRSAA